MRYLKFLLCFALLLSGVEGWGQIYINSYAFGIISNDLLLDSFPNAKAAFSLRKLDKDYAGNCIQVRRKSDNTTSNVGFVSDFVDTVSMKNFCGSGLTDTCFISIWYDQSGNGLNAENSTQAEQPYLAIGDTLQYFGDKLGVRFRQDRLEILNSNDDFKFLHDGTAWSTAIAASIGISSNPNAYYSYFGTAVLSAEVGFVLSYDDRSIASLNNAHIAYAAPRVGADYPINVAIQNQVTPNQKNLIYGDFDADIASPNQADRAIVYYNNGSALKGNASTVAQSTANATNNLSIGDVLGFTADTLYEGTIYEIVIWAESKSSNRTSIQSNLNTFYSIY